MTPLANSKRSAILAVTAVVVIVVAFFYARLQPPLSGDDPGLRDPRVGDVAPDFTLRTVANTAETSLAEYRGRVVLIDFWATYCGPCRRSMPHLQQVHERLPTEDFVLLSVNVDGPADNRTELVTSFASQFNLTHPILMDTGQASWLYQATRIPLVVIVDRDGNIARIYRGTTDTRWIDQALETLIDQAPSTATASR